MRASGKVSAGFSLAQEDQPQGAVSLLLAVCGCLRKLMYVCGCLRVYVCECARTCVCAYVRAQVSV